MAGAPLLDHYGDGLGFMLQDRGALFSLEPGHLNVYEPGKRPFHTIIPAFVTKDGEPWLSFGVMGGAMQPQGHTQVLLNRVVFGMDVQEAGDAARFRHTSEGVALESGIRQSVVDDLDRLIATKHARR